MPLVRSEPRRSSDSGEPPSLLQDLTAASAYARWAAARAAAGQPEAVSALAHALERERDARVLGAMFTALAQIGTPESVTAVLPYVRSEIAYLRTFALDALRAMPDPTEPHLHQLLIDPDSDVRLLACDLARAMNGPGVQPLLCAVVESDPDPNVCAAAVEVLSEIGDSKAVPSLQRGLARFADDPFLAFALAAAVKRLIEPDRA